MYLEFILGRRGEEGGVSSKLLYPFLELSHAPWFVPVLQVAYKASSCRYIRWRFQVLISGNTNEESAVIPNFTDTTYIDSNLLPSLPISTPSRPSTELASVALSIHTSEAPPEGSPAPNWWLSQGEHTYTVFHHFLYSRGILACVDLYRRSMDETTQLFAEFHRST